MLERRHAVLVRRFGYREASGGSGARRGGNGLVRLLEFLAPRTTVSVLSERRCMPPRGICGGGNALCGENYALIVKQRGGGGSGSGAHALMDFVDESVRVLDGAARDADAQTVHYDAKKYRKVYLGGKNTCELRAGDCILIKTPGGGAYGSAARNGDAALARD